MHILKSLLDAAKEPKRQMMLVMRFAPVVAFVIELPFNTRGIARSAWSQKLTNAARAVKLL